MSLRPNLRLLWERLNADAGREFIRSPIGSVSYGRLASLVPRFCSAFDQAQAGEGERVVIVTDNEPVAGSAFLAALLDGLVPVMLSPDSSKDRIEAICASVDPRLIVAGQAVTDGLAFSSLNDGQLIRISPGARLETTRQGLNVLWRGMTRLFKSTADEESIALPANGRDPRLPAADDQLGYILFTSGTTSLPSGVQISRNSLMAQLETLTRLFTYNADSRIFNATPLAHTDGLVQGLLLAVANGATLLRPGPFALSNLEGWLDSLGRFEATHFITNPTVLSLIHRFAGHEDYFDDERFFGILSSASILRPDLWEKFEARFGCSIYNMYGMTETVANATYAGRHPEMGPVGSIGIPVDCELRLMGVGADGSQLESPSEGEIQIRGENVFQGYWKNAERTTQTLLPNGWMRTGDLARRRNDGGFDIVGRIKTMINMGGMSVVPEEIDEVLAAHPAVMDAATVGFGDLEFEEVAISAVVLERSASENELAEHCRQRLEPLKVPKRILAVERIPRGAAGKPKTVELRTLLEPLLASRSAGPTGMDSGLISADAVFRLAAEVFRVPSEGLNANSSPATVDGWDSFNQLNLMIEAETRFGVRIPASQVASIRTLGDLFQSINASR
ncbi:AMP-binding protein [Pseudomonadota bacterium]